MRCYLVTFVAESPEGRLCYWQRRVFADHASAAASELMQWLADAGWVDADIAVLQQVSGCDDAPAILRRVDLELPREVANR